MMSAKNNSSNIKIAIVDNFRFYNWYSYMLARAMTREFNNDVDIYLYERKKKKNVENHSNNLKAVWTSLLYPLQIPIQAKRDKIDIIHLQFEFVTFGSPYYSVLVIPLLFILKIIGIKTVVTLHGPIFPRNSNKKLLKMLFPASAIPIRMVQWYCLSIYRLVNHLANRIIVHAKVFKKWLNENGIEGADVIYHGIECSTKSYEAVTEIKKGYTDKVIFNFGVLSPRKGLENLIAAFAKISGGNPECRLVIAGGEPTYYKGYLDMLKQYVVEQGIGDKVDFLGNVDDTQVASLFEKSMIVSVLYPYSVAASGPLAQAMGFGKPIIASATDYFAEILTNREDAMLVPPDNIMSIAENMQYLVQNKDLRDKLIAGVTKTAKMYQWHIIADDTINLYKEILNKHLNNFEGHSR